MDTNLQSATIQELVYSAPGIARLQAFKAKLENASIGIKEIEQMKEKYWAIISLLANDADLPEAEQLVNELRARLHIINAILK